jgi:hypothetical protein
MAFNLDHGIEVLERTPHVLRSLLDGLPDHWTRRNEGGNTWSPYDVVGHLIHGERTDWMTRLRIILEDGPNKTFAKFDRFAQFRESEGKSLEQLLAEFADARRDNLAALRALALSESDLDRTGIHPVFGEVTARQLLATWVAHDLDHVVQISRVMAYQLATDVGPWQKYLRIVTPDDRVIG